MIPEIRSLFFFTALFAISAGSAPGQIPRTQKADRSQARYFALTLDNNTVKNPVGSVLYRYGVPFVQAVLPLRSGGSAEVSVGGRAGRIFLLGMTDANAASLQADELTYSLHSGAGPRTLAAYGWADPRDYSHRFFVGDTLGAIRLNYADGSTQVFPLLLGESVWFGRAFYDYQDPFSTDARLRRALAASLRLYPPVPVADGNYMAMIVPEHKSIRSITVENSPAKKGTIVIKGITVESSDSADLSAAKSFAQSAPDPELAAFLRAKAFRAQGKDQLLSAQQLDQLRKALYSSDEEYAGHVTPSSPPYYSGPEVSFRGDISAEILSNAFRYNVQDILDKIDAEGMYHTSTRDALSWGGYRGFGTFRPDVGSYYGVSYTRDMGRSLQEIAELGYTDAVMRCVDYSLRMARSYATDPKLKLKNVSLPPHWGALVNHPGNPSFESDGQGLTILAIYKLWRQLPDRDSWLRERWTDIKASGDWILWQFAHPDISGSANGLLHTTGESANGDGYSVYPDAVCMDALRALAQMADSVGDSESAAQWRQRADQMSAAITKHYVLDDPKYGPVWTLDYSNWTHKSTVLGPLVFQADDWGFAPEDSNPEWRAINEASYRRLIDTYRPFGFYGQSMGYGQGFVTQSALLLDRMRDATRMLEWMGKEIYDPRFGSFIVPEGVQIDPTGRYWFRMGDLGNGVQEAEIVKTLRILIGVDDTRPDRLQFFPRMPYDWNEISVRKYPLIFESSGGIKAALLSYRLTRSHEAMSLSISSDKDLGVVAMRLGPFASRPNASSVRLNGRIAAGTSVVTSGDSWWIRLNVPVRQSTQKSDSDMLDTSPKEERTDIRAGR